jgi:outer membrane protein assembly factor BamB
MTSRLHVAGFFVFVLFSVLIVKADEWPQYRGPLATGKSADSIGKLDWSSGPKILWKKPTPLGFSSFSIADGRAFTLVARKNEGGNEVQTCLAMNADTGEELWGFPLSQHDYNGGGGAAGAQGNKGGDGPRSTPAVDGDRVYVYDAQLQLVCIDAVKGKLIWRRDVEKDFAGQIIKWANATSPVIDGDMVFVAGGGPGESLIAFNKMDGKVVWKTGDEKLTHATPVMSTINDKKQLIYFMQSGLVAVDPATGNEIWRTEFPFRISTAASPVVDGNLVYCSAGYGVGAGLFRINDSMKAENVWLKPNRLVNHWSTPVVHEGHLYGLFSFKQYGKGPLKCVELESGEIKWEEPGFGAGNCVIVGDKVVVLSDAGELVVASASPDKYKELARAKVLKGKCWSTPAYSNGRVYLRSTEEGVCIDLK